ncbi:hypothetical protein [Streptomyces sp. ISL-94]|uniref:hypothetical protein n=1 Tax=Streptomyces sp. ISL-94 TaxID=2819190 RepID=UPI001BEC02FF|nr:hypothetical protein [Streptomyces sp. ISL-94]MBT2478684.1 hypothetical protein [Streptomyces sp. ISL-94]
MKIKSMLAAGALALAAVSAAAPMATAAEADDTSGITDTVAGLSSVDALGTFPFSNDETWGAEESPNALSDLSDFTDSLHDAARQALEDGQ